MTIMSLLNQIEEGDVVLPAIQRDFVWDEESTEKLLDSILRGYPIGIALLWETYEDIQYRSFVRDFRSGQLDAYRDNKKGQRLRLVLDGQQRLQSLYIALFGTREGKQLYLDVLSGQRSDDVAEDRFYFYFLERGDADERNAMALADRQVPIDERDVDLREWLVPVAELYRMGTAEKKTLVKDLTSRLDLSEAENLRVDVTVATLDEVLTKDQNILRVSTIDDGLPSSSPSRKTEADVVEIFVRINREGMKLSRSDLIFSMLKLNWKESAEALPEFVAGVNEGNSFSIDTDFVIRCLFAVTDLGSRLDLDVLRKRSNVKALQSNFPKCCDAIRSTVDFVQTEGHVASSPLIGGINTMVTLVYYIFHAKKHHVPNDQVDNVRRALYLFGFSRPFSRYADSRIGSFISRELRPLVRSGDQSFPIDAAIYWVRHWERIGSLEELAQRNPRLALHLVQGLTGAKAQYRMNAPELDHIFPRSTLRTKGVREDQINNFANFWILGKGKNINKSNKHPRDYFADVSDLQMRRALIPREKLDWRSFTTFLDTRKKAILHELGKRAQLSDADFED